MNEQRRYCEDCQSWVLPSKIRDCKSPTCPAHIKKAAIPEKPNIQDKTINKQRRYCEDCQCFITSTDNCGNANCIDFLQKNVVPENGNTCVEIPTGEIKMADVTDAIDYNELIKDIENIIEDDMLDHDQDESLRAAIYCIKELMQVRKDNVVAVKEGRIEHPPVEKSDLYIAKINRDNQPEFATIPKQHSNLILAVEEARRLAVKSPGQRYGIFTMLRYAEIPVPTKVVWRDTTYRIN